MGRELEEVAMRSCEGTIHRTNTRQLCRKVPISVGECLQLDVCRLRVVEAACSEEARADAVESPHVKCVRVVEDGAREVARKLGCGLEYCWQQNKHSEHSKRRMAMHSSL